jgi:hypothetical protein
MSFFLAWGPTCTDEAYVLVERGGLKSGTRSEGGD